jgi:hypothetical protein
MKKPMYLLLGLLLLGACQNSHERLDPNTELSAVIGGQVFSARPIVTRQMSNFLVLEGSQPRRSQLVIILGGGGDILQPFVAEFAAAGMEVLNPRAMTVIGGPDIYQVNISYIDTEKGESWLSMTPPEGSGGQLVVTKSGGQTFEGEFSGTLWGPIRRDRDDWKDPRNLRPLKIEKGVLRVRLAN